MAQLNDALIILSPAFPENESDSTWVPSQQLLVRALKRNYPDLHVIVLSFLYPYRSSTYEFYGAEVVSFNGMRQRKIKRLLLWKNVWMKMLSLRKKYKVIGLFGFWCGEEAMVGKYFGKLYKIRHWCWISGQDAKKNNKYVKLMRPKPGELAAMSAFLVDEFQANHGVRPALILPNAIEPSLFKKTHVARDIDVLSVGSLLPFKQYDQVIDIVHAMQKTIPGICSVHCGDGPEKAALQTLIQQYKLDGNISLAGLTPHNEVLSLMQQAKVFLHPSTAEGFSTVCLEALYAGAHVISFCDPTGERIPHWHIVKNTDEMFRKALELLNDPSTEFHSVLLYSMDSTAIALMQLFNYGIVTGNGAPG